MNIFFHILAVYVRTGDHGKCSRIIKIASNWPDVQILLLQHIPRFKERFLFFIHQTVFNVSYQTVSQFICHRLSFGNPAPFFVVWINRTSSFVGTHIVIKRDHNVFVQIEKLFQMWSASRSISSCTNPSACAS